MFIWKFGSHWLANVCSMLKSLPIKWTRMVLLVFWLILTLRGGWPLATKIFIIVFVFHCILPCPITFWTSLQLGDASTMEVNTDWKSQQIFIFVDLKRPLNRQKKKKTSIEKNLNKTVEHCIKENVYKFITKNVLCSLLLSMSAVEKSVR